MASAQDHNRDDAEGITGPSDLEWFSSIERSINAMGKRWDAERENIYDKIDEVQATINQEFKSILVKLQDIQRPNWGIMVALFSVLLTLVALFGALIMFAQRSSIEPLDARMRHVESTQTSQNALNEMTIRNDERWSLVLSGHLRIPREPAAATPTN
jgi:hypothetical protein